MSKKTKSQTKTVFVGCTVDLMLVQALDALCRREGRSRSQQLRRILSTALVMEG